MDQSLYFTPSTAPVFSATEHELLQTRLSWPRNNGTRSFFSLRDTTLTVMLSSAGTRLNVNRD